MGTEQTMVLSVARRHMARVGADAAAIAARLTPEQRQILLRLHSFPYDVRHPAAGKRSTHEVLLRLGLLNKVVEVYPKGSDPQYVDPLKTKKPLILTDLGHAVAEVINQMGKRVASVGSSKAVDVVHALNDLYMMSYTLEDVELGTADESYDEETFIGDFRGNLDGIIDTLKVLSRLPPEEAKTFIKTFHDKSRMVLKHALI